MVDRFKLAKMTRVYLAGPYSAGTAGGVSDNINKAREVAQYLWNEDYAVFCPHLNSAYMEGPYDRFLSGCLTWLAMAQVVVLLPKWQDSRGTIAEVQEAFELDIPVYEWDEDECTPTLNPLTAEVLNGL